MKQFEKKVYSQNGEDGIIEEIFNRIGTTNKFFVEFGVQSGSECNTRLLRKHGWTGVWMDSSYENTNVHKVFLTVENINETFAKFEVPKEFDLLSIDIDGNDFWMWQALKKYEPRVVVIEYNAQISPEKVLTIPYNPKFRQCSSPTRDDFFGASLGAFIELGKRKGYEYLCVNELVNKKYVNAFFVKSEYISRFDNIKIPKAIFTRFRHDSTKYELLINPFGKKS